MRANSELNTSKMTGRPSGYTPAKADTICDEIADGKSLRSVCARKAMPDKKTVLRWLRQNEDFRAQYARAREAAADAAYEDIVEIESKLMAKEMHPNTARVLIDSIKWRASKLKPKVYGDRSQVDLGGGLDVNKQWLHDEAPDWMQERLQRQSKERACQDGGTEEEAVLLTGITSGAIKH